MARLLFDMAGSIQQPLDHMAPAVAGFWLPGGALA
jgi:hypothetical protein